MKEGKHPICTHHYPEWPQYSEEMVEIVASILKSGRVNYWTGGEGRQFETEYADSVGSRYAVSLANGTLALEAALYSLEISAGDEIITSSRTFLASASCAVMRGARPVLCDVDRTSQGMTADSIKTCITGKTRAIIVVHLAGWPCDMDSIMDLARNHGLSVIEDCAQAHGATYRGRNVGSIGHVGAFSFCQDKIITTGGEGGMLVTDDHSIWEKVWSYKDHGKNWDAVYNKSHPPGFRWLHESFGSNWRMTEMQAALGRIQLKLLPEWLNTRRRNAKILNDRFSIIPALRTTIPGPEIEHAYYKYYVFVQPNELNSGWNRDRIMEAIIAEGVPCGTGSCSEIYLEKAFPESWRPSKRLPVAKELGETALMFPVHPTLSIEDMDSIASAVEMVVSVASR
ncbi:DegT/DnrJ/EryC1/StrS family aminotransferase [Candidatus Zixiibacteriota bacterium]